MICEKCGKEYSEENVLCENCRAELTQEKEKPETEKKTSNPQSTFSYCMLFSFVAFVLCTIINFSSATTVTPSMMSVFLGFVLAIVSIVLSIICIIMLITKKRKIKSMNDVALPLISLIFSLVLLISNFS